MWRYTLYPAGKTLARFLYWLFGPVRYEGRENVPRRGGVLVCANHISDADPALMGAAVPRTAWFMAKEELFHIRVIGRLIRWYHAFPVRRGVPDRVALRRAEDLLKAGECVVMFPEGQCSEDGELQPVLPGAALILKRSQAVCVCAGIVGSNRIIPYGKVFPRRSGPGVVSVRFGPPLDLAGVKERDEITDRIAAEFRQLTGGSPERNPVPPPLAGGG